MNKIATLVTAAALTAVSSFAFAGQGLGPSGFNNNPSTVAEVLKNAYDDQVVVLQGRLTKYLGHDRYEFTDLQGGTIEVELDDDRNWSFISKDELIEIQGKFDDDFLDKKIDVKNAYSLEMHERDITHQGPTHPLLK